MTRVAGVVLAGGRSQRFGSDKAVAPYRGRPLIDWSIAALAPHCDMLFVSGHDHAGYRRVADRPSAGLGPLGGLAGALAEAGAAGYSHLLSLPCDTPEVPVALMERLCATTGAYVAGCPVIGLWRTADGAALEDWLAADKPRSVRAWAEASDYSAIEAEPILNINRITDIA